MTAVMITIIQNNFQVMNPAATSMSARIKITAQIIAKTFIEVDFRFILQY